MVAGQWERGTLGIFTCMCVLRSLARPEEGDRSFKEVVSHLTGLLGSEPMCSAERLSC